MMQAGAVALGDFLEDTVLFAHKPTGVYANCEAANWLNYDLHPFYSTEYIVQDILDEKVETQSNAFISTSCDDRSAIRPRFRTQ